MSGFLRTLSPILEANENIELDLLVNFSKLSLKENQSNIMSVPVFDTKLLDNIPKFNGNPLELSSFLEIANNYISLYWDQNPANINCSQNIALIYGIYSKLEGEAREIYSICISKDWQTVKDTLIAHFGDQRDENGLLFDLTHLKQNPNEPFIRFYTRVMSNLSGLHNYIDTHETDQTAKSTKKTFYNNYALKIFLAGLNEPLGSTIRAMRPISLVQARQFIIEESNIRHIQNNQTPKIQNFKRVPNRNNSVRQNYNSKFNQNFVPPLLGNHTNNQPFNNNNIPTTSRNPGFQHNSQQNYYYNKQNSYAGNKSNISNGQSRFSNRSYNSYKPTPMSGISHGTSRQNSFNQNSHPNVISEEMFNIEPSENDTNYSDFQIENTNQNLDQTGINFPTAQSQRDNS